MSNLGPFTAFPLVGTVGDDSQVGQSFLSISGYAMPGKWTLISAPKKFGWEIRKGNFQSGAVVFPLGDDLVVAKFRGEFWDQTDFALFRTVREILFKKGVVSIAGLPVVAALGIIHPELSALGVDSVVVQQINPLVQVDGGLWTTEIEFLQYRKPIPAVKKPERTTPGIAPPVPVATSALQIEIQKTQAAVQAEMAK